MYTFAKQEDFTLCIFVAFLFTFLVMVLSVYLIIILTSIK